VDVSPAALCNAFRYNYGDQEGCTMLLDIGAKTSNLLFFEKGKVYSRSINIGANSITQDFATESKLPFVEAEEVKIMEGFVSLGGAYAEPENARQAAISKVARQVMTRLHIQVNQTIQFYRGQQGGSAPQRLFLSGGASVMPYTSQFFAEKLNVPVDYFNPFRNIQIDPGLNLEEVAKVAHSFGEVVGLGLRNLAHCPVELNLMPESSIQRQQFAQKKPYLIAAVFSLVLVIFAIVWFYDRIVAIKETAASKLEAQVAPLLQKKNSVNVARGEVEGLKKEADKIMGLVDARFYWAELLNEVRRIMIETEAKSKEQLNTEVGIWIKTFSPTLPTGTDFAAPAAGPSEFVDPAFAARYGVGKGAGMPAPTPAAAPSADSANDITTITLLCEGVNLDKISPSANGKVAYVLKDELMKSPYFSTNDGVVLDPAGVKIETVPTT
ncbi:MAG: pilus assembly protein PilM, partial [Limisphaerales bacterium]